MKTKFKITGPVRRPHGRRGLCGLQAAGAATVDLAGVPMVSGVSKVVPPNIYFILDDSGSMDDEYMPDDVGSSQQHEELLPQLRLQQDLLQPQRHLRAAEERGRHVVRELELYRREGRRLHRPTSATVDLSKTRLQRSATIRSPTTNGSKTVTVAHSGHGFTAGTVVSFLAVRGRSAASRSAAQLHDHQRRDQFLHDHSVANNATSSGTGEWRQRQSSRDRAATTYFYYDYTSNPTSPPDDLRVRRLLHQGGAIDGAQKTNFANWYSYYRKRILMMKSASGRAFATVDDKYRVGFSTISEKATGASKFLNVGKFDCCDSTRRSTTSTTKLYAASPASYTPLRGALSKAGRLYSGTLTGAERQRPTRCSIPASRTSRS